MNVVSLGSGLGTSNRPPILREQHPVDMRATGEDDLHLHGEHDYALDSEASKPLVDVHISRILCLGLGSLEHVNWRYELTHYVIFGIPEQFVRHSALYDPPVIHDRYPVA